MNLPMMVKQDCERLWTMRGRPKRYENQADKQKAYRERRKAQVQPLRKSAADYWAEKRNEYDVLLVQHRHRFPKCELDYPAWSKEQQRLLDLWWDAHGKAYYLLCFEQDWFITQSVRFKMLPHIHQWIEEYDHANG
jgi:hypothetical protein